MPLPLPVTVIPAVGSGITVQLPNSPTFDQQTAFLFVGSLYCNGQYNQ